MAALRRPGVGRGATVALVAAVVLAACGTQTGPEPGQSADTDATGVPASGGTAGFPSCADVPQLRADDALYRDQPVYGNAEELVQEVIGWSSAQPGDTEVGLDRERNGWVTIWTTGDAEELNAQIADRWPEEGVVAVQVTYSSAQLAGFATRAQTALQEAGIRTSGTAALPQQGVASLYLGVITPEAQEVLAQFAGDPLCVDGMSAEEAPEDKPQPTEGEGWRLLGEDTTGESYRTSVATTDEQLQGLWQEAGLAGEPPEVDWEAEVVVWFGAVYGSGCPVRLDGVVVADDLLHADLVVPGEVYGCNGDANPHAFVLAVGRDLLPEGPFRMQLTAQDPPGGSPEERTLVDVDLSAAGSTATSEQIHPDADLLEPGPPPLVVDGDELEADQSVRYIYHDDPDCEVPVIGPLGGSRWRLADGEAPWDVEDGEELTLYPLTPEDDVLFASTQQMDWLFARVADGQSCP